MHAALRHQSGHADFSDSMIVAAAGRANAFPLYTLDRKAARLENVVLLEVGVD